MFRSCFDENSPLGLLPPPVEADVQLKPEVGLAYSQRASPTALAIERYSHAMIPLKLVVYVGQVFVVGIDEVEPFGV